MSSYRVVTYIDGFNLYFGIREYCERSDLRRPDDPKPPLNWRQCLWLNIHALAARLLTKEQSLEHIKYFTSRITNNCDKEQRQNTYLEALNTLQGVSIIFGKYETEERECRYCHRIYHADNEKMTDVNIAVHMLQDAINDRYDTAILISGDSDQCGTVKAVQELGKRVVVFCPPRRYSTALKNIADHTSAIGIYTVASCKLPYEVQRADGFLLRCPAKWWNG
jgi:uncharacterized LabA/DUF88 family protein